MVQVIPETPGPGHLSVVHNATTLGSYVTAVLHALEARGVKPQRVLARIGLDHPARRNEDARGEREQQRKQGQDARTAKGGEDAHAAGFMLTAMR